MSFGRNFRVLKSTGNLAVKVFCSWDFKVYRKTSVRLQSETISTQLKVRKTLHSTCVFKYTQFRKLKPLFQQELLSELIQREDERSFLQRLLYLLVHLIGWTVCLGSVCMGATAVHFLSEVRGDGCCAARHDEVHEQLSSCKGP